MHKTTFAGLTELDSGDSIAVDGASFTQRNPGITDYYLRIGAVTHRHDAHPPLPDPQGTPSLTMSTASGQIPAGTSVQVAYTLVDSDGGETRKSAAAVITSPNGPNPPSTAPTAVFSSSGGALPVGQYAYAYTLNDAGGGETVLSPAAFVQRPAGYPSGHVDLSGLSSGVDGTNFVSWNLWRMKDGGLFQIIASGTTNTFTDNGLNCTDASRKPPSDMTGVLGHNLLGVLLPTQAQDPSMASGQQINLYLSPDGSFTNPCLYATYPIASAGANIGIPQLTVLNGAPPVVSLASQGAQKIDPDQDMLNFPWKRPVPTASALPTTGNADGDMREALDTHRLYAWDASGGQWRQVGIAPAVQVLDASGSSSQDSSVQFVGASGVVVHVVDLGGGSGRVTVSGPPSAAAAGGASAPSFVTALPASPSDGQEVYLQVAPASGINWHLRYNAGSSSPYKWEYLGGASIENAVDASEATASSAFVDLTTVGPSLVLPSVPSGGDYLIEWGYSYAAGAINGDSYVGVAINGVVQGTAGSPGAVSQEGGSGQPAGATYESWRKRRFNGIPAGATVKLMYRGGSAVSTSFLDRQLVITPIRVG